jgi:hypothetical protein
VMIWNLSFAGTFATSTIERNTLDSNLHQAHNIHP